MIPFLPKKNKSQLNIAPFRQTRRRHERYGFLKPNQNLHSELGLEPQASNGLIRNSSLATPLGLDYSRTLKRPDLGFSIGAKGACRKRQFFRAILRNAGRTLFPACKIFGPNRTKMFHVKHFGTIFTRCVCKTFPGFPHCGFVAKANWPATLGKTSIRRPNCPLP
jgi:hypothetical protein